MAEHYSLYLAKHRNVRARAEAFREMHAEAMQRSAAALEASRAALRAVAHIETLPKGRLSPPFKKERPLSPSP